MTAEGAGLRPYQAQAAAAVTAGLRVGGRGQPLTACGTGKTRVAAAVAGALAPGSSEFQAIPSALHPQLTVGATYAP